jgi:2-polyprenyl-6-methoxyphenol hydroxylase-like FAD-dependent oxidoreductase
VPELVTALDDAGAARYNQVEALPAAATGGVRDGDEMFTALTARRPVIEAAGASVASATPGVTVRRGIAVAGLTTADAVAPGDIPHVTGVVTEDGEEVAADLVVKATGRRSPLRRWLQSLGRDCLVDQADSGFVYYRPALPLHRRLASRADRGAAGAPQLVLDPDPARRQRHVGSRHRRERQGRRLPGSQGACAVGARRERVPASDAVDRCRATRRRRRDHGQDRGPAQSLRRRRRAVRDGPGRVGDS